MRRALQINLVMTIVALATHICFAQKIIVIESVTLDHDEIQAVWPPKEWRSRMRSVPGCEESQARLRVSVKLNQTMPVGASLFFTPTAGRIVETGTDVTWDLVDVISGKYSLTVGVASRDILVSNLITKTVTVIECQNCTMLPCSCSSVMLVEPSGQVKAGDTFLVHAKIGGTDGIGYSWSASIGEIIAGKNSGSVVIKTAKADAGKQTSVTLYLSGQDPACNCPTSYSVSIPIEKP